MKNCAWYVLSKLVSHWQHTTYSKDICIWQVLSNLAIYKSLTICKSLSREKITQWVLIIVVLHSFEEKGNKGKKTKVTVQKETKNNYPRELMQTDGHRYGSCYYICQGQQNRNGSISYFILRHPFSLPQLSPTILGFLNVWASAAPPGREQMVCRCLIRSTL